MENKVRAETKLLSNFGFSCGGAAKFRRVNNSTAYSMVSVNLNLLSIALAVGWDSIPEITTTFLLKLRVIADCT